MKKNVLISWSGGKDSSLALYEIQKSRDYEVTALITTVTSDYDSRRYFAMRKSRITEQQIAFALRQADEAILIFYPINFV